MATEREARKATIPVLTSITRDHRDSRVTTRRRLPYLVPPTSHAPTALQTPIQTLAAGFIPHFSAVYLAFFLKALDPVAVAVVQQGPAPWGVELSANGKASLCLYQAEEKPAHFHLAFTAENRQQVEVFYRAAMEAGGKDNGVPGLCREYHANYYAAFVIGPDGHNIEVVCHEPEA